VTGSCENDNEQLSAAQTNVVPYSQSEKSELMITRSIISIHPMSHYYLILLVYEI
jgi:hypothetical protein